MGSDHSDSDFDFEDTYDEEDWSDLRRRVKKLPPDTPTNQNTVEQPPQDQMNFINSSISTPERWGGKLRPFCPLLWMS